MGGEKTNGPESEYETKEADEDPNDPRNQLRVVRDIPVSKAVQLVREKIEGIMEGGPDGLRRAFRVFDADMNGAISYAEFDSVMKRRLNLRFEPGLLAELMASFDDTGTGSINYKQFCERILKPYSDRFWDEGCAAPDIKGFKASIPLKKGMQKNQVP